MFSKNELIDIAIKIEKNGEQVYLSAIEKVDDGRLRELLKWMAGEEHRHAEWLSNLKDKIEDKGPGTMFKEMGDSLIRDSIGDQAFSLREVDFSTIGNTGELIDIFVEFEKDTILFYEMMKTFVIDKDALALLDKIISEEEAHIKNAKEFAQSAMRP